MPEIPALGVGAILRASAAMAWMNRVCGAVMIGPGLRIAVSEPL